MRTIKFRAWHKKDKEMHEVTNLKLPNETENEWIVAMQYTGLHDKDGKEIYEGDIIDFAGLKPIEILWEENRFRTKMHSSEPIDLSKEGCESFAEVIGNKFENPELLKE